MALVVLSPNFMERRNFRWLEKARKEYIYIRAKNKRKHNHFAPGALYKNLLKGHFVLLDQNVEVQNGILISVVDILAPLRHCKNNPFHVLLG